MADSMANVMTLWFIILERLVWPRWIGRPVMPTDNREFRPPQHRRRGIAESLPASAPPAIIYRYSCRSKLSGKEADRHEVTLLMLITSCYNARVTNGGDSALGIAE